MELQHVNFKIFLSGEPEVDIEPIVEAFHRWTAAQSVDEMLIDVADYVHVPAGPGIVLVGHEADYALDNAQHKWGLLYNRKAPVDGSNLDRFTQAFAAAINACARLEEEVGLTFDRQQFQLMINDRALAPNTPETLATCKHDIEAFIQSHLGQSEYTLEAESNARRRFGVLAKLSQPFDLTVGSNS